MLSGLTSINFLKDNFYVSTDKFLEQLQGLKTFPKVHWSRTSEHQESTSPEYRNEGNKIC